MIILILIASILAACDSNGVPASNTPTPTVNFPDQSVTAPTIASAQATVENILATAEAMPTVDSPISTGALDLTKLDPCALLTKEEITALMGDVPVAPHPMTQTEDHTACSYVEPTLEVNSPRLFLSVEPPALWDYHVKDVTSVSGVGDKAETADFDGWRTIWVLVNNKAVVSLDIYPQDTEAAKQLAQKAIDRLP